MPASAANQGKMLVQADEMNYDYKQCPCLASRQRSNLSQRRDAQPQRGTYDQRDKRVHAEGERPPTGRTAK